MDEVQGEPIGDGMRRSIETLACCAGFLLAAVAGCDDGEEADGDASADGDVDVAGDAAPDSLADGASDAGADEDRREADADGSPTLVAEDVALAAISVAFTADRICDLDGDGASDNAMAELGESGSEGAAMLWNALAEAALRDGYGPGFLAPALEDGGRSTLIALSGDATTLGGVVRAPYESMDSCGEPLFAHEGDLLNDGRLDLSASAYPLLLSDAVAPGDARVTGELSVGDDGIEVTLEECVATTIAELGALPGPTQTRGLTLLEVVLAGGSALGMSGSPGLLPDLDLDGDGLERVRLDSDGRVLECVDGDTTVIPGRDCWSDDRMADAFSWARRASFEETDFAGRFEGWLSHCPGGYPRPSRFGEGWNVVGDSQLALGYSHSCFRGQDSMIRCWGEGGFGQLGYGNVEAIGDDEPACAAGAIDVGAAVLSVTAGSAHTCAIMEERRLKCWGYLGVYDEILGDDEIPATIDAYELDAPVQQIVAGLMHHCALLSGGRVRCWGLGDYGVLGQGNVEEIVSSDVSLAPDVPVGGRVAVLAAGPVHNCAILEEGGVRCWGEGAGGRLGYGNEERIGDDELPTEAGDVDLGGPAIAIAAGHTHTCALLEGGSVRCWGIAAGGVLGYGNEENIGDDETPASAGDVDLGGPAVAIAAAGLQSCALLEGGSLRCWGQGTGGALGYGNVENIGDDETPASAGDVDLGGTVVDFDLGILHACAILADGAVRCWGQGVGGVLGYGNEENIGDDETPASAGNVPVICDP